jgi:hypothetical protein
VIDVIPRIGPDLAAILRDSIAKREIPTPPKEKR